MEKRSVKINGVYRHFKGNLYRVLCVAKHSDTMEELVIYKAMYGSGDVYARPVYMFLEMVDKEKYPNIQQIYRFELIEEKE